MKALFVGIFLCTGIIVQAQPYLRYDVSALGCFTTNTNIDIGDNGANRNDRNETVAFVIGGTTSLNIGYSIKNKYWIEVGAGIYRLQETHHISSPIIFGDYRNADIPIQFWYIPTKLGMNVAEKKRLRVGIYAGATVLAERMIVDAVLFENVGAGPLKSKRPQSYHADYQLYSNGFAYFATLLTIGSRVNYKISDHFLVNVDVGLSTGFRIIQSSGMFVTEVRPDITITENNFASTKGDALGLSIGIAYSFSKPNKQQE